MIKTFVVFPTYIYHYREFIISPLTKFQNSDLDYDFLHVYLKNYQPQGVINY